MIKAELLNQAFTQSYGSCVLASYAIVANYFSRLPIESYFQAYCRHFSINLDCNCEYASAEHFDREWKSRNCKGYQVILDVHNHSKLPEFETSRSLFNTRFFEVSLQFFQEIKEILETQEAFANITFCQENQCHSVTVFSTNHGFCVRDTNQTGLIPFDFNPMKFNFRDAVLYSRK